MGNRVQCFTRTHALCARGVHDSDEETSLVETQLNGVFPQTQKEEAHFAIEPHDEDFIDEEPQDE